MSLLANGPDVGALRVVGWTLAHSLWIGALLAAALALGLRLLPAVFASLRYRAAVACLLAVPIATAGVGAWMLGDWGDHVACWRFLEDGPGSATEPLPGRCVQHVGKGVAASLPIALPEGGVLRASSVERLLTDGTRLLGLDRISFPLRRPVIAASRFLELGVGVWALFAAAALLRFLAGFLAVRRAIRRARPVRDGAAPPWLERMSARAGVDRQVEVRLTSDLDSPGLAGWWKPVLLVPADLWHARPGEDLRPILAHELIHVRRRDYPVNSIQRLTEALFFFNPFLRRISARVRLEREAARDREVVGTGLATAHGYVRALAAAETRRARPRLPACGFRDGRGDLLERVRRLAPEGRGDQARAPERVGPTALSVAAGVALALLTSVLAWQAVSLSSYGVMAVDNQERPTAVRTAVPPRDAEPRTY